MHPQVHVPQKTILDPNLPANRPFWKVTLDDGTTVIGKPSWLGNSGDVALPDGATGPMTDWQRLKVKCRDENRRIVSASLFCAGHWTLAPDNKAGYGYSELTEKTLAGSSHQHPRSAVTALFLYWAEGERAEAYKVHARGILEHWKYPKWPACMIGKA